MLAAAQFVGVGCGDKMVRISSADIPFFRAADRRRRCRQELADRFDFRGGERRRLDRRALLHRAVHTTHVRLTGWASCLLVVCSGEFQLFSLCEAEEFLAKI